MEGTSEKTYIHKLPAGNIPHSYQRGYNNWQMLQRQTLPESTRILGHQLSIIARRVNNEVLMVRAQEHGLNHPAPSWHVAQWFNTNSDLNLETLRGRVIALHTFQMLCPGCVAHGIPQAQRLQETFAATDLAVVGLHTVFEHHDAMQPHALRAFLHEYRIDFPVGVDAHEVGKDIPLTMHAYRMYGTPTLILIDKLGVMRYHVFGRPQDMSVGAQVAMLISERGPTDSLENPGNIEQKTDSGCDDMGCSLDR